jgi:hypothetical protein
MSENEATTEEFVNVLAGRLILGRLAHDEREYKALENYCIQLARLSWACARARARAKAMLTQSEYEAAVERAFRYADS